MNMFSRLVQGFFNFTKDPSLLRISSGIPESQAVLCDNCHTVVRLRGFVIDPQLGDSCPECHSINLKFIPAWIRTPEEQKIHWEGRKVRTGKITAINGGVPMPLQGPLQGPLQATLVSVNGKKVSAESAK